jgi:hypothetical protein
LFRKPAVNVQWIKCTNKSEGKLEQKYDADNEQFLELISVFKEVKRNFIFIFLLNKTGRKINKNCECTERTDLDVSVKLWNDLKTQAVRARLIYS